MAAFNENYELNCRWLSYEAIDVDIWFSLSHLVMSLPFHFSFSPSLLLLSPIDSFSNSLISSAVLNRASFIQPEQIIINLRFEQRIIVVCMCVCANFQPHQDFPVGFRLHATMHGWAKRYVISNRAFCVAFGAAMGNHYGRRKPSHIVCDFGIGHWLNDFCSTNRHSYYHANRNKTQISEHQQRKVAERSPFLSLFVPFFVSLSHFPPQTHIHAQNNRKKIFHFDWEKKLALYLLLILLLLLFLLSFSLCFLQFQNVFSLCRGRRGCVRDIWTQIDLARPNAMYAANSMYIANSATGVTISHPGQLPTTFPPPPAVFANRPTINLINASNDTTDGNSTITTTANSGGGINSSNTSNVNKRDISTDTTVSSVFLYNFTIKPWLFP